MTDGIESDPEQRKSATKGSDDSSRQDSMLEDSSVIAAAYEGVELQGLIQRQVNHYLVEHSEDYRVGMVKSVQRGSGLPTVFSRLTLSYSSDGTIARERVFGSEALCNLVEARYREAEALYGVLDNRVRSLDRKLGNSGSRVVAAPTRSALDVALAAFCDAFVERISAAMPRDAVFSLAEANNDISLSVGFHYLETIAGSRYLRYFATGGWMLHERVSKELRDLHAKSSVASSRLEFILKLVFIASVRKYFTHHQGKRVYPLRARDRTPPIHGGLVLDHSLNWLLDHYLSSGAEKQRWIRVHEMLKEHFGDSRTSFESVLRTLLLSSEWSQPSHLGIYPSLLQLGSEINSPKFNIELTNEKRNSEELWDYLVVTRIEDFFMGNGWWDLFSRGNPFHVYLFARPIFFRKHCLGDFFATGSYLEGRADDIKRTVLPRISGIIPFLEKEFEYLARFVLTCKIMDRRSDAEGGAEKGTEGYEDNIRRVAREFGLPSRNPIWRRALETFEPTFDKIRDRILSHALRSAFSGIMSRNTSHNIGSHVDFYMSDQGNIEALIRGNITGGSSVIAQLFRYHRERLDFISQIVTSEPCWVLPMRLYEDVVGPFRDQWALLRYIGASEDISKIELRVCYKGKEITEQPRGGDATEIANDVLVGMVSGIVGTHALYSILENIIRNSAKHSVRDETRDAIAVTIDIEDFDARLFRVRIFDDASQYDKDAADEMNGYLCEPLIDEYGKPTPGGWGLKEMRICAEYLRQLPPERAEWNIFRNRQLGKPATLSVGRVDGWLATELYLPKPAELCIVDPGLYADDIDSGFEQRGISVSVKELDQLAKGGVAHRVLLINIRRHQRTRVLKTVRGHRAELPVRMLAAIENGDDELGGELASLGVLAMSEKQYVDLLRDLRNGARASELLLEVHSAWIARLSERVSAYSKGPLELWLGCDAPNATGFSRWKDIAATFNEVFTPYRFRMRTFLDGDEVTLGGESETAGQDGEVKAIICEHHKSIYVSNGFGEKLPSWVLCYDGDHKAGSSACTFLFNPPNEILYGQLAALSLIEAGLTKVCVVDERIYKAAGAKSGLKNALGRAGICLVDGIDYARAKSADLDRIKEQSGDCQFLLIHQGVLDKGFSSHRGNMEKWIEGVGDTGTITVVVSGRGIPHDVPRNARFLPLSAVDKWLLESRSKLHLVQTLMASKRNEDR